MKKKVDHEELMRSENKYRAIFENSLDAILLTGLEGEIYSVNDAGCRMFGRSETEIYRLGRDCLVDLTDPRLEILLKERGKNGKAFGELTMLRKDGTKFPAELSSSVFLDAEGRQVTSMIIRDISERLQNEKLIQLQSEILGNISEGINLIRQEDEIIVFTNPKFEKMFGYGPGEIIGKNVSVLNAQNEKSPDETKQEILEVLNRTGEWHGEILNKKKNGEPFWCYVNVSEFDHPDHGRVFLSVHTDITERKRAEEALLKSEAAFRSIYENTVMGISQAYPGGKLIRINHAYASMYGFPDTSTMLNEINDTVIKLYANPSDREKVLDLLDKNGTMPPTEFELIRRDGQRFWALVAAKQVRDDNGNLLYLQAEHIDITCLKNTQKELQESNEKHRLIMEHSGLGIAYYTIEGKILMFNNVALKNMGGNLSDYIGKNVKEVFGVEAGMIYIERFRVASESEGPVIYEDYVELDGNPGWYLSTHARILDQDGEVDGIQVIADNITELKLTEIKLKESQKKYQNLSRHLEEMLEKERSAIAINLHDDLGQKLTVLDLDLAWIRGRVGVQSPLVKKKFSEMTLMINEILGNIKEISSLLRPSILFDLGLYPAVISLLDKFQKTSGIRCHFQPNTEEINIDNHISLIIYRVLQEALTNIARHSGASTAEITISVSDKRFDMSIKDNGKGIAELEINSITSMGITGIKERVRAVHGKVKIKGEKDSGTCVIISIPLTQSKND